RDSPLPQRKSREPRGLIYFSCGARFKSLPRPAARREGEQAGEEQECKHETSHSRRSRCRISDEHADGAENDHQSEQNHPSKHCVELLKKLDGIARQRNLPGKPKDHVEANRLSKHRSSAPFQASRIPATQFECFQMLARAAEQAVGNFAKKPRQKVRMHLASYL